MSHNHCSLRDEFYLRKLSWFLNQGLDLQGAADMAKLVTNIRFDQRVDLRPLTNADVQWDQDCYQEEQGVVRQDQ